VASGIVPPYQQGYNVAEYLLEVASDPPVGLFQMQRSQTTTSTDNRATITDGKAYPESESSEKVLGTSGQQDGAVTTGGSAPQAVSRRSGYETTFLTQLQYLCGREWKILKRDKTLFLTHVLVAAVLGVFCGEEFHLFD
jgi:hypothetical protein